jgi:hypothetical protein
VILDFQARIDSGGVENRRLFYDFDSGTLLTTLKYPMTDAKLDGFVRQWMAEHDIK